MNNPRKLLIKVLTVVGILMVLLFIYSRVKPIINGPEYQYVNLQEISYQDEYVVSIEAQLIHTQEAKVNGIAVPINQDGNIRYLLALVPGHNIIELELNDNFGNTNISTYQVITPPSDKIYPPLYNEQHRDTEELPDDSIIITNE